MKFSQKEVSKTAFYKSGVILLGGLFHVALFVGIVFFMKPLFEYLEKSFDKIALNLGWT